MRKLLLLISLTLLSCSAKTPTSNINLLEELKKRDDSIIALDKKLQQLEIIIKTKDEELTFVKKELALLEQKTNNSNLNENFHTDNKAVVKIPLSEASNDFYLSATSDTILVIDLEAALKSYQIEQILEQEFQINIMQRIKEWDDFQELELR